MPARWQGTNTGGSMGIEKVILIGAAIVLLALVIYAFNRLVMLKHRVRAAWSDIDVQLKRRYDVIPKLVEAVKAYGNFEQTLQLQVARLRGANQTAAAAASRGQEESRLSGLVMNIFALAEAYPKLRASENFLNLQRELSEVENQVQYARRYYNGAVRDLNVLIQQFPTNLIARWFRFAQAEYFEIELATERESPAMEF